MNVGAVGASKADELGGGSLYRTGESIAAEAGPGFLDPPLLLPEAFSGVSARPVASRFFKVSLGARRERAELKSGFNGEDTAGACSSSAMRFWGMTEGVRLLRGGDGSAIARVRRGERKEKGRTVYNGPGHSDWEFWTRQGRVGKSTVNKASQVAKLQGA